MSQTGLNLDWSSKPVPGATAYKVYRNGALIATVPQLTFADSGLQPSTTYNYAVAGTNSGGDGPTGVASGTTLPPQNTSPSTMHKFNTAYYAVAGQAGQAGGGTVAYVDTTVTPNITYQINTNLGTFLNSQFPGNNAALSGVFTAFHATTFQQAGQGKFVFDGSANDPILSAYMAVQAAWRKARGIAKGDQARFGFMMGWAVNTSGSNNTATLAKAFDFAGSAGVAPPFIRDCAKTQTASNGTVANYNGTGKTVGFCDLFNNVGYTQQAHGPTIWNPGGATTRYYFGIQPSKSGLCGHAYTGFNGSNYITVYPTTWELGTTKNQKNEIFALSVYKLPYTDSAGNVTWYTLDMHPLVECIWFADETSANFDQSESTMYPVSIDTGTYPAGNKLCATGYWNANYDLYGAFCANFTETELGIPPNFLFTTGQSDDDTAAGYNAKLQHIADNFPNVALCGPDTYGNAWGAKPQATLAQQAALGITNPNNTTLNAIVLGNSVAGQMDIWLQIQDPDWSNHLVAGHAAYSAQTGADIFASGNGHSNTVGQYTLGATKALVWNTTDRFATSDWSTLIYPAIVAASTATPLNTIRPSNWPIVLPLTLTVQGTPPDPAVDVAYELVVSVSGGTGAYVWDVDSGDPAAEAAPLGANTGLFTWTPSSNGTSPFVIRATDSLGNTGTITI